MRFPERGAAALLALLLAVSPAHAAPEGARAEIAARLQAAWPGMALADFALGAAAFDAQLKAEAASHAEDGAAALREGKAIFERRFRNGRSLAACFPNGGRRVAAAYPLYDSKLKRVITLETAINQCLKSHNEPLLDPLEAPMARVTAWLRSLANGQKVAVRVPPAAEERFEQGRRLYFSRLGQRNFACASCHVQGAGRRFGEVALSAALGQAAHWPVIRGGEAVTMQARMRECLDLMGAAPFPAGSDELNHLEYFLAYLSNGLPLKANAWRPGAAR